ALVAWCGFAPPEITLHDWTIESILHSSFSADPSGVPSSKYARRNQFPSQAFFSTAVFRSSICLRYRLARPRSFRSLQNGTKSDSVLIKNQPTQTLSPLPSLPTVFIPSSQSPDPISGKPCAPTARLRSIDRTQCSNMFADSTETAGCV